MAFWRLQYYVPDCKWFAQHVFQAARNNASILRFSYLNLLCILQCMNAPTVEHHAQGLSPPAPPSPLVCYSQQQNHLQTVNHGCCDKLYQLAAFQQLIAHSTHGTFPCACHPKVACIGTSQCQLAKPGACCYCSPPDNCRPCIMQMNCYWDRQLL